MSVFERDITETERCEFLKAGDKSKAQVFSNNVDKSPFEVYVEHSPALEPRSDSFSVYRRVEVIITTCAFNVVLRKPNV